MAVKQSDSMRLIALHRESSRKLYTIRQALNRQKRNVFARLSLDALATILFLLKGEENSERRILRRRARVSRARSKDGQELLRVVS